MVRFLILISITILPIGFSSAQDLFVIERKSLEFGESLFPGIDESVTYTDSKAAEFEISGDAEAEIRINFILPIYLNYNGSELPLSFGSITAGYHILETGQSTATAFDPNEGITTLLGSDGNIFVWLGGTVHPSRNQQKGAYFGDIILEVEYTGN